jgi:protein-S-isoprenylcysteine O-methyltransferase Ste14
MPGREIAGPVSWYQCAMKTAGLVLRSLLFLVLVPGSVLLLIPYWILQAKGATLQPIFFLHYLAPFFWLVGTSVLLWCFWAFIVKGRGTPIPLEPPQELVVQGLYRLVRNPMYGGAILILASHVLWFQNGWLLLYSSAIFLAFHAFIVFYEEPTLRRRFDVSYIRYTKAAPRWLPRLCNPLCLS